MPKRYSFDFAGTKEMFLNQLNKYPHNNQNFFYFDDYIVKLSDGDIHFGVARGGHSGGYWYVPTLIESDNKITFCGTIQYLDPYTSKKGIEKIAYRIEEILLWIILFPIIIIVKMYLFFSWIISKIFKLNKPKEESLEDKLYNLMENHLNCTKQ